MFLEVNDQPLTKKPPFADKLLRKLLDDTSAQEIFAAGKPSSRFERATKSIPGRFLPELEPRAMSAFLESIFSERAFDDAWLTASFGRVEPHGLRI